MIRALLFLLPATALAYTGPVGGVYTTTGSDSDVQAAIAAAVDGNIIDIPAGTFGWSAGVDITGKGIHLRGAGGSPIKGSSTTSLAPGTGTKVFTTIQSGLAWAAGNPIYCVNSTDGSKNMTGTVTSYSGTTLTCNITSSAGSGTETFWTFVQPAVTTITNNTGTAVEVTNDASHHAEISGILFAEGTSTGFHVDVVDTPGALPTRIHDCRFSTGGGMSQSITLHTNTCLIYNCSFDCEWGWDTTTGGGNNDGGIVAYWDAAPSGSNWAANSTLGALDTTGKKNVYIEGCWFSTILMAIDPGSNARHVIRYCTFDNASIVSHGFDSGPASVRHWEIYNNTFLFQSAGDQTMPLNGWFYCRGGTGVITDNVMPNITSAYWGDKNEVTFQLQGLRWNVKGLHSDYPWTAELPPTLPQQHGWGASGGASVIDPMYIWNNTGTVAIDTDDYNPNDFVPPDFVPGADLHTSTYVQAGREWYTTAKSGYTKYTYPHPLRHDALGGILAASTSTADVQAAVDSASDGDTILIPNGSASWSSGITTTKQIIIRAQNYTATPAGTVGAGASSRNVIITNNSSSPLFQFTTGNTAHCGVGGIRFNEGSGTANNVRFNGTGTKPGFLFDNFMQVKQRNGSSTDIAVVTFLGTGGIAWNNVLSSDGIFTGGPASPYGVDGGSIVIKSSRAWTTASTMGTLDTGGITNVYWEASTFLNIGQCPDLDVQGRAVFRYCNFDGSWGLTHGFIPEATPPAVGRHSEHYNCIFQVTYNSPPYRAISGRYFWNRGGTSLFTDNTLNTPANVSEWGNITQLNIGDSHSEPSGYPTEMQPGFGHNGSAHVSDPIYIWNESGARAYTTSFNGTWGTVVQSGRDLFVNAGAKPGYAKFTYPHPLRFDAGPDTTAPTLTATTIAASGVLATLSFSEAVVRNAATPTLSLSGGPVTAAYSTGSGTGSHVYTLSRTVNAPETGTLSVTLAANNWEDSAGNDMATISGATVTNASTQGGGVGGRTLGQSRVLRFTP